MAPVTEIVRDFTTNTSPDEGLRQIIVFLFNASRDYNFSFNEEKTILSILKTQIMSIVVDKYGDINVTVDIDDIRYNVLSVVLNNLFPPHPVSGEVACWLLDNGASIEFTHPSALLKAIIVNNADLVRKLIESGMQPVDLKVRYSETLSPLKVALMMKQETLVMFFAEHSFLTKSDAHTISCYLANHVRISPKSLFKLSKVCCSALIGIRDRKKKLDQLKSYLPKPYLDEIENVFGQIVLHSEEVDIVEKLLIAIYRSVPFTTLRNPT